MAGWDELKTKTGELLEEGMRTGVLTPEEFTWRQGHLARAESVGDLEVLVVDLLDPGAPAAAPSTEVSLARTSLTTVMADRTFTALDLGRRTEVVTVMGSARIDLRDLAPGQRLHLELVTIMGDLVIEVPEGRTVRLEASPVMGDAQVDPGLKAADAEIRVSGIVVMASLRVKRVPGTAQRIG